jgi:hypothetical protein
MKTGRKRKSHQTNRTVVMGELPVAQWQKREERERAEARAGIELVKTGARQSPKQSVGEPVMRGPRLRVGRVLD